MDLSQNVLGMSTVRTLQARVSTAILEIGSDRFTRRDLSKVDCFNFNAAQNLSAVLNKALNVPNLRHVFDKVNPAELALPRLGAISLAVLAAAFEAKGIGGDAPLENYLKKHGLQVQTFHTIKINEQAEQAAEKKAAKSRKRDRKDGAHAKRIDRFEARVAKGQVG